MINDYELIYLVQCHHDGVALEFIFKKYERLIWKYIHFYNVPQKDQDDFLQEGLILLNKAINIFDENRGKTFTRYFELIVRRHIIYLKNKLPKVLIYENFDVFAGSNYVIEEEPINFEFKTELENKIFEMYFLKSIKINEISNLLDLKEKQIYNTIFRIKQKVKDLL